MAPEQRPKNRARKRAKPSPVERFWALVSKRLLERGGEPPEVMFVLGMHKVQKDGAVDWDITVLQGSLDASECALGHGDRNVCKSAAAAAAEYFFTEVNGETMTALRTEFVRKASEGASAALNTAGAKLLDFVAHLATKR